MSEQEPRSNNPGMDFDFFQRVYSPAVISGRPEAAQLLFDAYVEGALSMAPTQPTDMVHPSESLLSVDFDKLTEIVNRPREEKSRLPKRVFSHVLQTASKVLFKR